MAQKSKRGGPYNKNKRNARRQKVYELHFEKGWTDVKIAQELKVSRNTINADIKYWYEKIGSLEKIYNPEQIVLATLERMSLRRIKLMELYETSTTINEKVQIEKAVNDIDYRIIHIQLKLATTTRRMFNLIYSKLNKILKENNINQEYATTFDQGIRVNESNEDVNKLLKN